MFVHVNTLQSMYVLNELLVQLMKDEYEALQITCTSIEDKSKQLQKENDQLVSIVI